ncbi:MAG: hypothetical protein ABI787_06420 [Spartobacteria bacterium]
MMKLLRAVATVVFLFGGLAGSRSVTASALSARAALPYFQEADTISRADDGRLWGITLGGPLLLVDPETRIVLANQPDTQGRLMRDGPLLRGKLPTDILLANSAVEWSQTKWAMIMLPLPEDRYSRATLMVHELWHRVQDELGLPSSDAQNNHLDTRDGRYWIQLEWRALAAALATEGPKRAAAITDAATFREQRRLLFPGAAAQENAMEMHEGLAEYTGVKLSGAPDLARFVIEGDLRAAPAKETFVRSFAYANGPAYGILLDTIGKEWRKGLKPTTDFAALLLDRAGLALPSDVSAAAKKRAPAYNAAALATEEDAREKKQRAKTQAYRARLVDGPVLKLPLRNMKMEFDPGNLVPLDSLGAVYPQIRIVDDWGVLTVSSQGALLSAGFSEATVAQPTETKAPALTGDGWTLELKPGWSVAPGSRKGDSQLRQTSTP